MRTKEEEYEEEEIPLEGAEGPEGIALLAAEDPPNQLVDEEEEHDAVDGDIDLKEEREESREGKEWKRVNMTIQGIEKE